jgi:hypothetical protein
MVSNVAEVEQLTALAPPAAGKVRVVHLVDHADEATLASVRRLGRLR